MSVKDINKSIIITDALTGNIITTIDSGLYTTDTVLYMLFDLFNDNVLANEHGLLIKVGYKN